MLKYFEYENTQESRIKFAVNKVNFDGVGFPQTHSECWAV